ncbi:hypothetical protein [Gordonia soli]|uniref:Uncharacterized protein n=1 Tax=Gordonia soli NBRC 108243 TaxID=1223545 RepID=M0QJ20_9ACTN|nr:hypothetical protein [Gordonia soli]GAC68434.1 hypothetical protein GS4_15_00840 [Gordonia soli NBRC 108243]
MSIPGVDLYHRNVLHRLAAGDIATVVRTALDPTTILDPVSVVSLFPQLPIAIQVAVLDELADHLERTPSHRNQIDGLTGLIYSWYHHPDPRIQTAAIRLTRFTDPDPARAARQLETVTETSETEFVALAQHQLQLLCSSRHEFTLNTDVSQALLGFIDDRINAVEVTATQTAVSTEVAIDTTVWTSEPLRHNEFIVEELCNDIDEFSDATGNRPVVEVAWRIGWPDQIDSRCVYLKHRPGHPAPALPTWARIPAEQTTTGTVYYPVAFAATAAALRGVVTAQFETVLLNLDTPDHIPIDVYIDPNPTEETNAAYNDLERALHAIPTDTPIRLRRHTGPPPPFDSLPDGTTGIFNRADPDYIWPPDEDDD